MCGELRGYLFPGDSLIGAGSFSGTEHLPNPVGRLDRAYTDLRNAQAAIILQEKLSSLGMLSASIAHGVHNPLFALSVSTRRLEELTSRLGTDWQKLESQGLSAEDRCTLQELLATVG